MRLQEHEGNLKKAREWIAKAVLILIIGANGSYGNAYFNYRKRGAKIIQINPADTAFDSFASLNIRADADEIISLHAILFSLHQHPGRCG